MEPGPRRLRKGNFNLSVRNLQYNRRDPCSPPKKRWARTDGSWKTPWREYTGKDARCPACSKVFPTRTQALILLGRPQASCVEKLAKVDYTKLPLEEVKRLDDIETQSRAKARKSGRNNWLTEVLKLRRLMIVGGANDRQFAACATVRSDAISRESDVFNAGISPWLGQCSVTFWFIANRCLLRDSEVVSGNQTASWPWFLAPTTWLAGISCFTVFAGMICVLCGTFEFFKGKPCRHCAARKTNGTGE